MRALRLSMAGTLMLALVGGLSATAVAQSDEVTTPAFVTGNEECQVVELATLVEDTASVQRYRGFVQECVDDMSDSRVTGTYTNVANWDDYVALLRGGGACAHHRLT